jgi:hypothetical protein
MKIETFVVKEITGAMKVISEDGPISLVEIVQVTCRSEYLWKKTTVPTRYLSVKEIEELNRRMPMVLIRATDDYGNQSGFFMKPRNSNSYFEHGHLEWEDFLDIVKNAQEVYPV